MKNIWAVVLLLVSLLSFGVVHAEQMKVENGVLTVAPDTVWFATGVKVTPEAQKYPDAVEKAYHTGKIVSVQNKHVYTVVSVFRFRRDTINTLGVQYDVQKAVVDTVVTKEVVTTEVRFNPFLLIWGAFLFWFLLSGKLETPSLLSSYAFWIIDFVLEFVLLASAVAFALFSLVLCFTETSLGSVVSFIAAASYLTHFLIDDDGKARKISKIVFYLSMFLLLGIEYTPLFM